MAYSRGKGANEPSEYMVTTAYEHLQPQRSHQFVGGVLGRNKIPDRGGSGAPELSLTGRNAIAEATTSCLYSVSVSTLLLLVVFVAHEADGQEAQGQNDAADKTATIEASKEN
ncbi:hypothetical protein EVAR_93402_1 [Eumeta japonica]|uniref:Uncharacterized protein n=1 Tax=Eumeta variegata TaxID=151549 RepID=A0A4C1UPV5_EUMVA|nr:hypothetical protein EVAR_93402_1 [Eumeta japonica]